MFRKIFSHFSTKKDFFSQNPQDLAQIISQVVIKDTEKVIEKFQTKMEFKLSEIDQNIEQLKLNIIDLERKLLSKEIKDKQSYGQLHYKLEEIKKFNIEQNQTEKKYVSK